MEAMKLAGRGIYTVVEASRLTHVSARRIRYWVEDRPVWQRELPDLGNSWALTFRDLIEVRFVDAFRRHGVSWRAIRLAASTAYEVLETSHPFSTRRFQTDGRTVFTRVVHESGASSLLDLVERQYAFDEVLGRYLYAGLDFSGLDEPQRWWPLGKKRPVVIDPARQFGQPVSAPEGVPTAVLNASFKAEGSLAGVARVFEVSVKSVKAAIDFERSLQSAA